MTALKVQQAIRSQANTAKAANSARFFRTQKGEYGYGDKFSGLTVPEQRAIAKQYRELPLPDVAKLLASKWHEERFTALEILVMQYPTPPRLRGASEAERQQQHKIAKFYLAHTTGINNWDLVDTSAPYILGHYLFAHPRQRKILTKLAASANLWQRRIAIVATQYFINQGRFTETLGLARRLLSDKHDLIHKAVGWMLREVGKKDQAVLEKFLTKYAPRMPRTTLRYAIERFPVSVRAEYLKM